MNLKAIKRTAVCAWSECDQCYVVESPLFDRCIGVGDTEAEADRIFAELLQDCYVMYLEDRLAGYKRPTGRSRGRPKKNGVAIHVSVQPETKNELASLATQLGCSTGETVDYLLRFWTASNKSA
jgi:predicted RNase H-like HicB family nuclease